jgi:phenylalanyl-tRNA synthetase beta chain
VVVPTFRVDLLREEDLIEEVGRHYGFDRLEPKYPPSIAPAPAPDPRFVRDRLVRRILTAAGLSEAVTFGFIEGKAAELFAPTSVAIANPLSGKFDTARPLLLPGLVDALAHNRRHGRRDVRLFEIGTRFAASGETRAVAFAWTGAAAAEHWSHPAREVDFFDIKGVVEMLCSALGVSPDFEPATTPFLVAGQTARVLVGRAPGARDPFAAPIAQRAPQPPGSPGEEDSGSPVTEHVLPAHGSAQETVIGFIGQLLDSIADARGLARHDAVFGAELDLDALDRVRALGSDATTPLPRHPFVVRDLSIVISDSLPAAIIRGTIQAAGGALAAPLVGVSFFDRYRGAGVPEGSVSLSVRLKFQAADRTLTDAEVQQSFDTILAALVRDHRAVQR